MDKRLMLAVAGSGKTTYLINQLCEEKRTLIVTYTRHNEYHLRRKILSKFGYLPKNITVRTYFSFIYNFCVSPFLKLRGGIKSICYLKKLPVSSNVNKKYKRRFMSQSGYLYHNRVGQLLDTMSLFPKIIERLETYYDNFFVDEVQDFGGHDFNVLIALSKANVNQIFVGDFFQHTFDTSRDGNTNKNLYNDYDRYISRFKKVGIEPDTTLLEYSWRCPQQICDFVTETLGIEISSKSERSGEVKIIESKEEWHKLFDDTSVTKLFYNKFYQYGIKEAENWGRCKGLEFENVCVVLTKNATHLLNEGRIKDLSPMSLCKLYVACTRTKNDLYIVPYHFLG